MSLRTPFSSWCLVALYFACPSLVRAQEVPAKKKVQPLLALSAGDASNILQHHKIAFSPDGRHLAAEGQHGYVVVWDAKTGEETLVLQTAPPKTWGLAFSPDGKFLAAGARSFILVWDARSGRLLSRLKNTTPMAASLAYRPGAPHLAVGGKDVKVVDTTTGEEVLVLRGHPEQIFTLAYSTDGKQLAAGGEGGVVKVWDATSGKELLSLQPGGSIADLSYSPDGRWLAAVEHQGGVVVWDATKGEQRLKLPGEGCVRFSSDSKLIASTARMKPAGETIFVCDAATGKERLVLEQDKLLTSLAFSPDGRRLTAISATAIVDVWDLDKLLDKAGQRVLAVAEMPKESDAKPEPLKRDKDAKPAEQRRPMFALDGQSKRGFDFMAQDNRVKFSTDGKRFAATGPDGSIRILEAATGKEVLAITMDQQVARPQRAAWDVAYSPDGKRLCVAYGDDTVKLWDASEGRAQEVLRVAAEGMLTIAYSPDGKHLAGGDRRGTVKLWDAATGNEVAQLVGHLDRVATVAFAPDGKRLASGSADGSIRLWDLSAKKEAKTLEHIGGVHSVAFSPNGQFIASAGLDARARSVVIVWDAATGRERRRLEGGSIVAFSPDSRFIASAAGEVRLWEVASGKLLLAIADEGDITDLVFSPDGKRILAVTSDYGIKLWDVTDVAARKP